MIPLYTHFKQLFLSKMNDDLCDEGCFTAHDDTYDGQIDLTQNITQGIHNDQILHVFHM
jgi:hypothetical protein